MSTDLKNSPPSEFQTERLVFKARSVDHAKEFYQLIDRNRDHLKPWMPWLDVTNKVEDTLGYLEMCIKWWAEGRIFDYTMFDKVTGKIIGSFGFHTINRKYKTWHLGYWIGKEFEGKGLVSEAIKAGEEIAKDLGIRRIGLTCDPLNERSKNSAVRNGYRFEGHFVEDTLERGEWRDTLQFVKILNDSVDGAITENFPSGFSFKEVSGDEFVKITGDLPKQLFDDKEIILRATSVISDEEKKKLEKLNENYERPNAYYAVLLHKNEVAGWTWGYQDAWESFYMVNSAVLPQHRGRGLYTRMLEIKMEKLVAMGYQKIWSRHNILNNAILIPKLKFGFQIIGHELSDFAGVLVHLAYYTNATRRKVLKFRSGAIRPDENLKKVLKLT